MSSSAAEVSELACRASSAPDEDPVTVEDDRLVLRLPDGEVVLRHRNGTPIPGFQPGWRARYLFVHFSPIYLLELVDVHGGEVTWFVTGQGERITDQIARLPDHALQAISEHVAEWIADPHSRAAQGARAAHARLNPCTRAQIPLGGFLSATVFDPLVLVDGVAFLRGGSGALTRLKLPSGAPAPPPTAQARLLHTGFAPLHVIEFAAAQHAAEPWLVHADGTFLGTSLDAVPPPLLAAVRRQGLAHRIAREATADASPPDEFMLLGPATRIGFEALAPRLDPGPALDRLQSGLAFAAGGRPLRAVATIHPQADPERFRRLSSGWFVDAEGCAWIIGTSSTLELEVTQASRAFGLRFDIAMVRDGTRMTLSIEGRMISSSLLCAAQNHGTSLSCFILPELVTSDRVRVEFSFDPPLHGAHAAFRLDMASLSADGEAPAPSRRPADHELLGCFESLGDSCELGFAQRHFALEPMSLFRFAGTRGLTTLIRLIETRFEGLGAPGSLRSTINVFNGRKEYMIWADGCGLFYHTWRDPAEIDEAELLAENEVKLAYLGRKMIEDLEDGEKIFVYKRNATRDLGEILSLHAALNQYGPNKLFWISQLEDGRHSCDVEWVAPDLLRGYCASFGRAETPPVEIWLKLCRSAWGKFSERSCAALAAAAPAAPAAPIFVAQAPYEGYADREAAAGMLTRLRRIFAGGRSGGHAC